MFSLLVIHYNHTLNTEAQEQNEPNFLLVIRIHFDKFLIYPKTKVQVARILAKKSHPHKFPVY